MALKSCKLKGKNYNVKEKYGYNQKDAEMNILICDDVSDVAIQLTKIISLSFPDAYIRTFNSAAGTLAFFRSGKIPDICFLDIIMPGMDGILLAEKLRTEGYGGPIVFLTLSNDFAAQSYKVEAFSYLLKPPNEKEVIAILHRVEKAYKERDAAGIHVKTKRITRFILHRDISHVEVINQKLFIRLIDGTEVEIWSSLSEIVPKLTGESRNSRFAQCHNSFVVNMDNISYIQGNTIIMKEGIKIPITKKYADFKKLYEKRVF